MTEFGSMLTLHACRQVLTFVGETRVLVINASDELEEDELAGFDADTQAWAQPQLKIARCFSWARAPSSPPHACK